MWTFGENLRVGVSHATLPSLNNDNSLALGENVQLESLGDTPLDAAVDILLPVNLAEVGLLLLEVEWVDAAVEVRVARGGGVAGNHENGADWSVLGQEASRLAGGGENKDGSCVHVEGGTDSSHGASLNGGDRASDSAAHLLEVADVWNSGLGLQAGAVHGSDGLDWVRSLGGLSRKHDAVGSISDSVSNIGNLSTGSTWVTNHGLQHLGSTDNWLSGNVAHGNHLLLGDVDLFVWDLDTEITTSDHDTISLLEDVREVVKTLTVLNLGDDLDVLALLTENVANGLDIGTRADEGGKDHINAILNTKLEVSLVLLGESWKVDISIWEVDTLLGRDVTVRLSASLQVLLVNDLKDLELELSIINADDGGGALLLDSLANDLGKVLVVNIARR